VLWPSRMGCIPSPRGLAVVAEARAGDARDDLGWRSLDRPERGQHLPACAGPGPGRACLISDPAIEASPDSPSPQDQPGPQPLRAAPRPERVAAGRRGLGHLLLSASVTPLGSSAYDSTVEDNLGLGVHQRREVTRTPRVVGRVGGGNPQASKRWPPDPPNRLHPSSGWARSRCRCRPSLRRRRAGPRRLDPLPAVRPSVKRTPMRGNRRR
jgi:hypothetical protein